MTRQEIEARMEQIERERFFIDMADFQTMAEKKRDRELYLEYYELKKVLDNMD